MAAKSVKLYFNHERDTKNMRKFNETPEPNNRNPISFYLPKDVSAKIGNPDSITITVAAA